MTKSDEETFKEARPYVVGAVALLIKLARGTRSQEEPFEDAEEFVRKFEGVNDIR